MPRHKAKATAAGQAFWKIAGAGAAFQAGSSAVDSATIVASLVHQMTGNVFAVGAASAVLRLGWLLPQIVVGFLAQRSSRWMARLSQTPMTQANSLSLERIWAHTPNLKC